MSSENALSQSHKLSLEIEKIPLVKRFIKKGEDFFNDRFCKNSCVFGMSTVVDFDVLDHIPVQTNGLYLYYGAAVKDLLEELVKLEVIRNIEHLTIGFSHGNGMNFSDYSEISKILASTHFPNLKFFEYGIDELTVNEGCVYGNLGDITEILENMPVLEKLHLFGNFQLIKSLKFQQLTNLEVLMNDASLNINGGKITNKTIQNLLSSDFNELSLLSLDLYLDDNVFEYSLPKIFLHGVNVHKLKYVQIEGNFIEGTKTEIITSDLFNRKYTAVEFEGINEV